jgi:hypothetical protein
MVETNPTADAPYRTAICVCSTLPIQQTFTRVSLGERKISSWSILKGRGFGEADRRQKEPIAILYGWTLTAQGEWHKELGLSP